MNIYFPRRLIKATARVVLGEETLGSGEEAGESGQGQGRGSRQLPSVQKAWGALEGSLLEVLLLGTLRKT